MEDRLRLFFRVSLLLYLVVPWGFGVTFIPGIKTMDLQKIIPLILTLLVLPNLSRKGNSITVYLFYLFAILDVISVVYSELGMKSFANSLGNSVFYYSGFLISYKFITTQLEMYKIIKIFRAVVAIYTLLSLTEFFLQYNVLDSLRFAYDPENSRFNPDLGMIRLGKKASMGPYASTLPFAYAFCSLLFISDFRLGRNIHNLWYNRILYVLAPLGIFLTLSRAAIFVMLSLYIFKFSISGKSIIKVLLIVIAMSNLSFITKVIPDDALARYIEQYILNINDSETATGVSSRFANNSIDFHFALQQPIFGHGSGVLLSKKQIGILNSADSSYFLTVFADRGLISLLLFLSLALSTFIRAMRLNGLMYLNFRYSSLNYSFIALLFCLNSSQRVEVLFLLFFIMGAINKLYIITKRDGSISNNANV